MSEAGRLLRWIVLCALAELLGIGAAGLWYGCANVLLGEPVALPARIGAWLVMSLAAVPEGVILGGLQAMGIRWFVPATSGRKWIYATIAVGFLGWAVGAGIPLFVFPGAAPEPAASPSLLAIAAFAAAFGVAVGAVFGFAQAVVLPVGWRGKGLWVLANALGWAVALPLIYVAAHVAAEFEAWSWWIALWSIGGLLAGATIGVATAGALYAMRDRAAVGGATS